MPQPSPHSIEELPRRAAARRRARTRDPQRGNTLVIALIARTGLATLGALTISTVEGGISSGTAERSHNIALYAAESGVMVGMRYLDEPTYSFVSPLPPTNGAGFSYVVLPGDNPYDLPGLPGNRRPPGHSENIFSPDLKAWYDVSVINNKTDPRYDQTTPADQEDSDGRIVFISTGYGPNRATATLEVEVMYDDAANKYAILSWREVE
jgi:hypothetical protein